jgi:uncharacterized protein YcbK (DUF882 family)
MLASCSTSSDPFAQLGLATAPEYQQQQAAAQTAEAAAPETDSGMYYIVAEDDPELPEQVAFLPSLANGEPPVTVAAAAQPELQPAAPAETAAGATAPQVDDAVLAARMGSDGAYLETVREQQQGTAAARPPAPQQPKKRGFFASLFAPAEPERPAPAPAQAAPQPEVEVASTEPQPAAPETTTAPAASDEIVAAAGQSEAEQHQAPQPTAYLENRPAEPAASPAPEPRKRGFLSAFFSSNAQAAPRVQQRRPEPVVQVAAAQPASTASASAANIYGNDVLPGVRGTDSLYEIKRKSGLDDDSDIDINEGDGYQLAMAPGLARLAPNGLLVQTDRVDVACLKPSLVRVLKAVERHFGEKVVVTSGYRSPPHNARARGARNSLHMYCAAADIQVAGVDKWELAQYVRSMPGRGGVGTYCHTKSVHVDVGPERDWNWRCRRRRK